MTTLAIVGAGPGLGAAVARRFGREGFSVALISRNQQHGDDLAASLAQDGVNAQAFQADVRDPGAIARTLEKVTEVLGPIEVLQYSPLPQKDFMRPVMETSVAELVGPIEFSIYGPVAAVRQVAPGMRFLGGGSIIFVNGGTAVQAKEGFTGTSVAFAGQAAYAEIAHEALKPDNIHVGQIIIPGSIEPGHPDKDPEVLAEKIWTIHAEKGEFRTFASSMDAEKDE